MKKLLLNKLSRFTSKLHPLAIGMMAVFMTLPAQSGIVIPDTPLQSGSPVPPNLWFVLDNSGSMGYIALYDEEIGPMTGLGADLNLTNDSIDDDFGNTNFSSRTSYISNTLHYNPNVNYQTWRTSTGGFLPNTPYSAVYSSTVVASGGTINLLNNDQIFHVPKTGITSFVDATQYYRYTLKTNGTLERRERTQSGGVWGWNNPTTISSPTWTDVNNNVINRSIAQEQQNFATWYSFHRTRMKVAKAGAGAAFSDLGENVRVGFDTINNSGSNRRAIPVATDNGLFRDLTTPTATTNRSGWYTRLYSITSSSSTPLRFAMRNAGNYFTDTSAAGPWGPETGTSQLACRQNFTIMTTDGYWNDSGFAQADGDSVAGPVHTTPTGLTYQYTPARPFLTGGDQANTLADESMFWWKRDLRTDMPNIVPTSSSNPAFWQHMVTFGVALLQGSVDTDTALPGLTSGPANWPNPMDAFDNERIDDLYHASVNGHGTFVEATSPDKFRDGLRAALANIVARTGSNSNVSANSAALGTDTRVYQASYISGQWTGELSSFSVNPDRTVNATPLWRASSLIPLPAARNIFTWDTTAATTFPTAAQTTALTADVVAYLRGDQSQEKQNGGTLRDRVNLLGDIVHSSPAFSGEAGSIFISANDGMLHAFNSTTGVEQFAYVPRGINLVDLKTIANPDYAHKFFVDGPVVVSERRQTQNVSNFTGARNILVGTLGRGGKGLFSLDVTNPAAMTAANVKWQSAVPADPLMGYIIGRPFIAKANNGMLVAVVPNGINSTNDRAGLFIYNLNTGAVLATIDTGVGSNAAPNGLSTPIGWDDNDDGILDYVYAGDLQGNMWRFDLSSVTASDWQLAANRKVLYAARDNSTPVKNQPITGTPVVAVDPVTSKRWVFFGTGQYLVTGDSGNEDVQTWYGVIDDGAAIAGRTALQQRSIALLGNVGGVEARAFEANAALDPLKQGWYIDLINPSPSVERGERMIGVQELFNDELRANSYVPNATGCGVGGKGYVNRIDAFTGTTTLAASFDVNGNGIFSDDVIGTGPGQTYVGSVANTSGGVNDGVNIVSGTGSTYNSTTTTGSNVSYQGRPPENLGRISWREILGN
jgi:type IV pilus assembly protein PilY1